MMAQASGRKPSLSCLSHLVSFLREKLTVNHAVGFVLIIASAWFIFRGPLQAAVASSSPSIASPMRGLPSTATGRSP